MAELAKRGNISSYLNDRAFHYFEINSVYTLILTTYKSNESIHQFKEIICLSFLKLAFIKAF